MKKSILFISAITFLLMSGNSFAQETKVVNNELNSIKKQVTLEEDNGVKTVTIRTNNNGDISEEVYTGEAADAKLAELESQKSTDDVEVKVEEVNGVLRMKIKRTVDGVVTFEEYEGEEAKAKLKELESSESSAVPTQQKKIIKEKKVVKSSNM